MDCMFVTLEVSNLSGRLNADAYCRESNGGHTMLGEVRAGRQEAAGDRGARSVQRRARLQTGSRAHGEERTWNMPCMVVTLELSKLSGWLNAYASCRGSKDGHTMRGEVRTERREGGRRPWCKQSTGEGSTVQIGDRTRGGAHAEHLVHVRDAGGVEAQRLVERQRGLPRVERRACGGTTCGLGGGRRRATVAHAACRRGLGCRLGAEHGEERTLNMPRIFVTLEVSKLSGWLNADAPCRESKGGHYACGMWEAGGGGRRRRTQRAGEGLAAGWGQGTGRSARVEAQRLVERRRALPRVERGAYGAGRGVPREAGGGRRPGDGGARSVQERARLQVGGRARGGAHPEHVLHGRDFGRVEAQRLVERQRGLPRVERRVYGAVRGCGQGGGEAAGDRGARSVQGRARLQIEGRARGGAHPKHVAHVRDTGGVEAQRLVEH
eukprot:scaffold19101_cov53-Phaeocystis_antarctica.AAC.6